MAGTPMVWHLALMVLAARNTEESALAFAALCIEDLAAARALEQLLIRAVPTSSSLWAAIMAKAESRTTKGNRFCPNGRYYSRKGAHDYAETPTQASRTSFADRQAG